MTTGFIMPEYMLEKSAVGFSIVHIVLQIRKQLPRGHRQSGTEESSQTRKK